MANFFRTAMLVIILIGHTCKSNAGDIPNYANPPIFEFHSGFWINLHHFVYNMARVRNPINGVGARKLIYADTIALNGLDDTTRKHWQEAIDYYAKNIIDKDLLSDAGLVKVKIALEDKENEPVLSGPELPAGLASVLNNVAPGYRALFWERQNRNNQLWIGLVQPMIGKYGDGLTATLGKLYLTHWPEEVIRVDVTNYASWSGAYTSLYPDRITISSVDSSNQGVAALETVFHEASHILIDSIMKRIDEILVKDKKSLPNPLLWHAILFYTTGEAVRRYFAQYTPYAYRNGLWKRAWPMYISYLEKDWQPYINGDVSFEVAIQRVVRDVEVPGKLP